MVCACVNVCVCVCVLCCVVGVCLKSGASLEKDHRCSPGCGRGSYENVFLHKTNEVHMRVHSFRHGKIYMPCMHVPTCQCNSCTSATRALYVVHTYAMRGPVMGRLIGYAPKHVFLLQKPDKRSILNNYFDILHMAHNIRGPGGAQTAQFTARPTDIGRATNWSV
jgi:hypothetical protein